MYVSHHTTREQAMIIYHSTRRPPHPRTARRSQTQRTPDTIAALAKKYGDAETQQKVREVMSRRVVWDDGPIVEVVFGD
jgi:hypothetical protein